MGSGNESGSEIKWEWWPESMIHLWQIVGKVVEDLIYHSGGWWWVRNDKWQYKWLWNSNWMGQWWPESTVHSWKIVGKVGEFIRVVVVVVHVVGEKWQVATKWTWNLMSHG